MNPAARDAVLHVGTGKTGSTSIQELMRLNREVLARHGWLYPRTPGPARHLRLGLSALPDDALRRTRSWRHGDISDPEVFRRRFRRRFAAELDGSGLPSVLLSDEGLWRVPDPARLRDLMDRFAQVRVIAYLRRQDDHMVSSYQQVVRSGSVVRLREFAAWDRSHVYDYAARLGEWQRGLGPAEIVVRLFERDRFDGGSLHQDFLTAAGVPVRADALTEPERRNESLDAEGTELVRLLNLLDREAGRTPGRGRDRPWTRRLAEQSDGPTLTLPEAELDRVMARWSETNAAVARDFLHAADGVLFRTPRRTEGTTTEQRLDPARLDHYLELLGIPEQQHADLRRIAEREAAR
jgi:hypothetical protein